MATCEEFDGNENMLNIRMLHHCVFSGPNVVTCSFCSALFPFPMPDDIKCEPTVEYSAKVVVKKDIEGHEICVVGYKSAKAISDIAKAAMASAKAMKASAKAAKASAKAAKAIAKAMKASAKVLSLPSLPSSSLPSSSLPSPSLPSSSLPSPSLSSLRSRKHRNSKANKKEFRECL